MKERKKGESNITSVLFWVILAVLVLVISFVAYAILFDKAGGAIGYLKDILKIG